MNTTFAATITATVRSSAPNLTLRQLAILFAAEKTPHLSVDAIAEDTGTSKPAVTRAIDRLFELDFIDRIKATADRRKVDVTVTKKGRAFIAGIGAVA